jgi:hypothetical protein
VEAASPTQLVSPYESAGLPHLANVVTDTTVDQVLDIIAKTFHGTILYETLGIER